MNLIAKSSVSPLNKEDLAIGYIYLIHNTISNKCYVGQTIQKDPEQRWNNHKYNSITGRGNRHLSSSIAKYGVDSFEFSVIDIVTAETTETLKKEITLAEDFWINYLKFVGAVMYNQRIATESNKGVKWSEESRKRQSIAKAGKPHTKKRMPMPLTQRQHLSELRKGKHQSEESRAKQSASTKGKPKPWKKGKPPSEETKAKMSEAHSGDKNHMYGKRLSEEQKQKISESRRGKGLGSRGPMSEEQKQKQSATMKGRPSPKKGQPLSPEAKVKISASKLGKPSPKKGIKLSEEQKEAIRAKRAATLTANQPNPEPQL